MKIEDLKVGTKLKVIKPYKHNGIAFKEGEIIEVTKIILHFYGAFSVKSQSYSSDVIVPSSFLFYCCEIIPSKVETKSTNKLSSDELLHTHSISSKTTINRAKYKVEISITFEGKKYTVGDFVRVKVDKTNYYGKIKEINAITIRLTKLSSNNVYTIELDKIAEMENIG
ncbi:hypothetical protein MCG45_16345 [Clostridium perfringens]|uniref:hypothetical protein n=1 Tax=Clostridium perfringens TaxID=1502 RepID=UPI001F06DF23|nr:hypothetical protein [Clostridium perfringens]MCH1964401.1 hypothetical protein [Clostridium perfringens]